MNNLVTIMDVEVEDVTAKYVGDSYIAGRFDYDDLFTHITTGVYEMARENTKGKDIVVGVIDTGVMSTHPLLEGKVISHHDFYPSDDKLAVDDNGHGTHVASLIVGKGIGAEDAKIRSFKVLGADGSGKLSDIADALEYIIGRSTISPYVDIINMSLGFGATAKTLDPDNFNRIHEAIKTLVNDLNVPVIVAAGNTSKRDELYPACFPEVISVGATTWRRTHSFFSTMNDEVDLAQCGFQVFGAYVFNGGIRYAKLSGTSMACPMITKIAVLLLSKYKRLFKTPMPESELWSNLKMNTVDMGAVGIDMVYGVGFCSLKPAYGQMSVHYRPNGTVEVREKWGTNGYITPYVKPHINEDDRFVMGYRDSFEVEGNIGFWVGGDDAKDEDGNLDPQGIVII